jgi:16S rRNA (adenine1518-N6/adenine1519-N6)-dimethyltransferase
MMSSQMKMPAKKRFGQHFLRDRGMIERIVRLIDPSPGDLIVEIGAGRGALSIPLASRAQRLIAIELDIECIPLLEESLASYPRASVLRADILELDLADLVLPFLDRYRLRLVGNLPYNIATALIEKLWPMNLPVRDMIFMLQLEVAERITSSPGAHAYGFLSVCCQHFADTEIEFKVPPACFVPRPKVNSAMIRLRPKPVSGDADYEQCFSNLVKAAFSHRRKTLANSLTRHPAIGALAEELLVAAGIDGRRRAEDLSVGEYESLARVYRSISSGASS